MKKLLMFLIIFSICAFCIISKGKLVLAGANSYIDVEITEGGSQLELENEHRYIITKDVLFTGDAQKRSGLKVQPDSKVIIEIKKDVTLTCQGFDSENTVLGGGAGIEVPESSILIITGEGYLNAYGGNGSSGFDGENGQPGAFSTKDHGRIYAGAGGNGGEGGGGAGAGIGGCGGEGAIGGTGGIFIGTEDENGKTYLFPDSEIPCALCNWEKGDCNGFNGQNGCDAYDGMNAGSIYIIGSLICNIQGGLEGFNDGRSGKQGASADDIGSGYKYNYSAGKSGGGGGGQKGHAAFPIGGGGAGGAGGGGGGAGSTRVQEDGRGFPNAGNGGVGGSVGSTGTKAGSQKGGDGGNGGASGAAGSVYRISIGKNVYIDKFSIAGYYLGEYYLDENTADIYTKEETYNVINKNSFIEICKEIECLNCYESYTCLDFSDKGYKTTNSLHGAYKSDNNDYYKTIIDTSGGYIYALAYSMEGIVAKEYTLTNDPWELANKIYEYYVTATGEQNGKLQKLIKAIFFYEHLCEPFNSNRSTPYVCGEPTDGRYVTYNGGLVPVHNTYIKIIDKYTKNEIQYSYKIERGPFATSIINPMHIFYYFTSPQITVEKYNNKINGKNWMDYIDGSTPITEINMPGTHDAGTYNLHYITEVVKLFTCQDRNIYKQLNDGVRVLDCRLHCDDDRVESSTFHSANCLRLQHWNAVCHKDNGDYLYMSDVINDCSKFLKENPGQVVIALYQAEEEKRPIYKECVENMLAECGDNDAFVLLKKGDKVPTLDEVRGKIIIMDWSNVLKLEDNYTISGFAKINYLIDKLGQSKKVDMSEKYINKDSTYPSPRILFASTEDEFEEIIPCPQTEAQIVNGAILNGELGLVEGYNYGWILVNFANDAVCKAIYSSNKFVTKPSLFAPHSREYIYDVVAIDADDIVEDRFFPLKDLDIPDTTNYGTKIIKTYSNTIDGEYTEEIPYFPGDYFMHLQIEGLEYSGAQMTIPISIEEEPKQQSGCLAVTASTLIGMFSMVGIVFAFRKRKM